MSFHISVVGGGVAKLFMDEVRSSQHVLDIANQSPS